MKSEYWDIDSLLAECQRITCFFNVDLPGSVLPEGSDDQPLRKNTRVELPLWLAKELFQGDCIEVELPACFSSRVSKSLQAAPCSANLGAQCSYFYLFGAKLSSIMKAPHISKMLVEVFKSRLVHIFDMSHTVTAPCKLQHLDETEKRLFHSAYEGRKSVLEWLSKKSSEYTVSDVIKNRPSAMPSFVLKP